MKWFMGALVFLSDGSPICPTSPHGSHGSFRDSEPMIHDRQEIIYTWTETFEWMYDCMPEWELDWLFDRM